MNIATKYVGDITINKEDIITFPDGLPGFEDYRQYVLVKFDIDVPFSFLQSITQADLAFVVTDPFLFHKEYALKLSNTVIEQLGIKDSSEVIVLSVVTLNDTMETSTMNLLAPLIINSTSNVGLQHILQDTDYKVKHALIDA